MAKTKKNGQIIVSKPRPQKVQAPANPPQPLTISGMLSAMIERGVTSDNVAALEKLVGLYERMQDKDAERAFSIAFNELQKETPSIVAKNPIPDKNNVVKYKYASYQDIMDKVQEPLIKHGFSITFNSRFAEGRYYASLTLLHIAGHSRTNEFGVRIGGGPPGSNESQADASAKSYAKRGCLCDALNIVIDHDDDARAQGHPIDEKEAAGLMAQVREICPEDEIPFLQYAGLKEIGVPPTIEDYKKIHDTDAGENFKRLTAALVTKKKAKDKAAKKNGGDTPTSSTHRESDGTFTW